MFSGWLPGFDRVWHSGLIYKLWQAKVDTTTLKCIIAMHSDCTSKVLHKGSKSLPFPVKQGTRQGGIVVSSPTLYLAYINGLI